MRRLSWLLILCTCVAVSVDSRGQSGSADERTLIQLINRERAKQGLAPLIANEHLAQAAREHTDLMIEQNKLAHRLPGEPDLTHRIAATGLAFDASGENVAYNSDVAAAHDAFMHSPGHRANILKPEFDSVGVGIRRQGDLLWVTEDFARKLTVTSAGRAAEIVAHRIEQVRTEAGLAAMMGVARPELAGMACSMAHNDHLGANDARHIPGARSVIEWNGGDPNWLPPQAERAASDPAFKKYSLGACYAPSASHPSPVFWIVLVVY